MKRDRFVRSVPVAGEEYLMYDLGLLGKEAGIEIGRLPFSIRVLVENLLRNLDGSVVREADLMRIGRWEKRYAEPVEIPYHPARVLMHDFTGIPALVDLAAMRDAMLALGLDPKRINPRVPVDFIVDHSVQIDFFGTEDSLEKNIRKEYARNGERYALLKWAQKSFDHLRLIPPGSGICHQINLEYLAKTVLKHESNGKPLLFPDTLIGTDSHTPMVNGIGVLGWGVGGIEAEGVMLGQPYFFSIPEVIGVRLQGDLAEGVTATDLVLALTEMLRALKVVDKFVEYFGGGVGRLSVPDRATIANMAPEYGATVGFFPVDEKTLDYLKLTGRSAEAKLAEAYARSAGLFRTGEETPDYTETVDFDLSEVRPSLAGPSRPQDRLLLGQLKDRFSAIPAVRGRSGAKPEIRVDLGRSEGRVSDGSVVIAAITSCTNTSNPSVMIGAGLFARNAVRKGLRVPPHVKTSLAPGSKVVVDYLKDAGLLPYLEALGFHAAGFGCTTCIGNGGPLHPEIERAISEKGLTVAAVLSGNRNFEARIHPSVKANFLASPILVVAFALAGRVDFDPEREPLGFDPNGAPILLSDLWPSAAEIGDLVKRHVRRAFFEEEYGRIEVGDENWKRLSIDESTTFPWDGESTYIRKPPYFEDFGEVPAPVSDILGARVLAVLGDSVTTDHISPAGAIPPENPAGRYLLDKGVGRSEFNTFGTRRGNHEVMVRGAFGNVRIRNRMVSPKEGGLTLKFPEKKEMFLYDAAVAYLREKVPLLILGGKEFGTGSSRDWAAKGPRLLGVRAVIAESFERIHRSNLIGMGVLPLVFRPGEGSEKLGLTGAEVYSIRGIEDIHPGKRLRVEAAPESGAPLLFEVTARLDTETDVDYYLNGGILPYVLRKLAWK
jgi:aconitate hydratase